MKAALVSSICILLRISIYASSVAWAGISADFDGPFPYEPPAYCTVLRGSVGNERGNMANVEGMMFVHNDSNGCYIRAYDYSETAAPVSTIWYVSYLGDVAGSDTEAFLNMVSLCNYLDCNTGGNRIDDPNDFYLVFKAEGWSDYINNVEGADVWYGWVNLRVNEEGGLEVLGSGINIDGGPVVVGETLGPIPEPSSALLAMLGLGFLALRRRCRVQLPR